jgi:hypothetical protein
MGMEAAAAITAMFDPIGLHCIAFLLVLARPG